MMTEVWSGTITTQNPAASIDDIHLWTSSRHSCDVLPRNARLHYLSLVHVSRIPLCVAAGPSLEVYTDHETSSKWLNESIIVQENSRPQDIIACEPWWSSVGAQSDYGLLLRVDYGGNGEPGKGSVTEVLLYGAVRANVAASHIPPASFAPNPSDESIQEQPPGGLCDVRLYALPLCSRVFDRAERAAGLLSPPPEECINANEAYFLPDGLDQGHDELTVHQKRQRLSALFDDATQKRRKLKGRGGESISHAMAGIDRPTSPRGMPPNVGRGDLDVSIPPQKGSTGRRGLTRASTIMSIASSDYPRPASRSGPSAGKRSSLHRVESAISSRESPTLSEFDSSFTYQNKAALTKVVMAGMRLHGLQQRKKPDKGSALDERTDKAIITDNLSGPSEEEDEYKLVYHQTFKAAAFAFRKHFSARTIGQELMRDIVDRILTVFCSDPLGMTGLQNGELMSFDTTGGDSFSAFDRPTFISSSSQPGIISSLPTAKKR